MDRPLLLTPCPKIRQLYKLNTRPFWETVEALDDIGLYPAALVAAAEVFDLEVLVGELAEFLYTEGDSHLLEMQDGIFETISINEDDETAQSIFYIYDKDPVSWEVAKEDV